MVRTQRRSWKEATGALRATRGAGARWPALAALLACGPPSAPPDAAAGGAARSAPAASAAGGPLATPAPASPTREGDGCWGLEVPAAPAARLDALGARCAPGLRRVFDQPPAVNLDGAGEAVVALPALPPGACVRSAAVAAGASVELALLEGTGGEVARDAHPAFSLAPPGGPACLGPDGRASLRVRRLGPAAPARAWVQAWSSLPPRLSRPRARPRASRRARAHGAAGAGAVSTGIVCHP
jgi:hypothetical protein